ncbi:MAG: hypothetical protein H6585_11235 [Flavobacteriales bacterium]|nr:hypothetical protein [Flavobacteriales bacterium]MCB9448908.1 hypothetical protein [Flavobacteriales bacterium]
MKKNTLKYLAGALLLTMAACQPGGNDDDTTANDSTAVSQAEEITSYGETWVSEGHVEVAMFKELLELGGEDQKTLDVGGSLQQAGANIVLDGGDGATLSMATKEFSVPEAWVGKQVVVKVQGDRQPGGDGSEFKFTALGVMLQK